MSRIARGGILLALCLVVVAGLVLTGCGKKEAALQEPQLELTNYVKGSTVDFDTTTLQTMAQGGGEAGFKYGIMKAIYPTIYAANKETVAQTLFPAPYWRGDGVNTYYSYLTSADQTTVDGYIFANPTNDPTKGLSAAEQAVVATAVTGFFDLYDDEVAAAEALEQNTAYGILLGMDSTGGLANAWKADAAVWMAALDSYANTNYSGKTYAQLTYVQRATVNGIVFANGSGTINPEYALWLAMTKNSFRNSIASSMNATARDSISASQYSKSYVELDCVQRPTVDAMVWYSLDATGQATVNGAVAGMLLSQAALDGVFAAGGMTTAQAGFDAEVAGGMNMELAFYKWLGYESFRNGTAVSFYPTQLGANVPAGKTYATLTSCERLPVNAAVWAALGVGEQTYVQGSNGALAGMWRKVQAEMTDAVAADQTFLSMNLRGAMGNETAATNFKADVAAGVDKKVAFYRWLAMEKVKEMASSALLIQESVGEFYVTIANPNKYEISIDQLKLYFKTTAGTSTIDGARQSLGGIWIPAEETVELKVLAPIKSYDLVSWLAMAGVDTTTARSMAAEVWSKIQNGTITWTLEYDMDVSHDNDIQSYSYPA